MGTLVSISADGPDASRVTAAMEDAFEAVALVERLMSFHDAESELCRLNRNAYTSPQVVHPWTYAVLARAQRISAASDGLFDITIAPLLVGSGHLPGTIEGTRVEYGWQHIQLSKDRHVQFTAPVMLDLGGIAKGFAVDVAIHALRRNGCTEASVNAGGDLRRYGRQAEIIHLRRASGLTPLAELRCGAIATSAAPESYDDRLEQPLGCIMDPRAGQPWSMGAAVTVAAWSCVVADALTKVAALAGPSCESLLERFGARARWHDQ